MLLKKRGSRLNGESNSPLAPEEEEELSIIRDKGEDPFNIRFGSINKDELMRRYWTKVYPQRSTVAEANRVDQGFTWENMNDDQFRGVLNQIREPDNDLYPRSY